MTERNLGGFLSKLLDRATNDEAFAGRMSTTEMAHAWPWFDELREIYTERLRAESEPTVATYPPREDECDYHQMRSKAQTMANSCGLDVGLSKQVEYGRTIYRVAFLPRADKRFGREQRAEIISPMVAPPQAGGER